jgi:hypothetical protein
VRRRLQAAFHGSTVPFLPGAGDGPLYAARKGAAVAQGQERAPVAAFKPREGLEVGTGATP